MYLAFRFCCLQLIVDWLFNSVGTITLCYACCLVLGVCSLVLDGLFYLDC